MKTFLKWSGNKTQHLNKIIQYVPKEFRTYIEPFVGSGAMFLKLQPKKWIINDINKDLINVWKNIQGNVNGVIRNLEEFESIFVKLPKEDQLSMCRQITGRLNDLPFSLDRACAFMLMTMCSYNGNLLVKDRFYFGGLNMHITKRNKYYFLGKKQYDNLQNIHTFMRVSGKLYNNDYKSILQKAKKGDFVFLDPPYVEDHYYGFKYNKDEKLDDTFLFELCKEVKRLDKRGVKWLMTQADTRKVKNIFKDFKIKTFPVYRAIPKTYTNELIIMNY